MKIALDLVRNSEMSLTEISAHIGLKSQSYFSKLFVNITSLATRCNETEKLLLFGAK